jgi:hypothetical protein
MLLAVTAMHLSNWVQVMLLLTVSQDAMVLIPILDPREDIWYCWAVVGLMMWNTLSDRRLDLHFPLLLVLASASVLDFNPTWFLLIYYCLRFGTHQTCMARSLYLSPRTRWSSYPVRHCVHLCQVLRLLGLWWRYSSLPPHEGRTMTDLLCNVSTDRTFHVITCFGLILSPIMWVRVFSTILSKKNYRVSF